MSYSFKINFGAAAVGTAFFGQLLVRKELLLYLLAGRTFIFLL